MNYEQALKQLEHWHLHFEKMFKTHNYKAMFEHIEKKSIFGTRFSDNWKEFIIILSSVNCIAVYENGGSLVLSFRQMTKNKDVEEREIVFELTLDTNNRWIAKDKNFFDLFISALKMKYTNY